MDLKNNVAELIFVFWQDFIYLFFLEMLKVNHPFQAQGDVINECREDGKTQHWNQIIFIWRNTLLHSWKRPELCSNLGLQTLSPIFF